MYKEQAYSRLYGGLEAQHEMNLSKDKTAENILDRLSDLETYPGKVLAPYEQAPYEQFVQDGKTYYFTPGGFLYRKDPGTEEVGGFFCGYLTDEVWDYYRSNTGQMRGRDLTGKG